MKVVFLGVADWANTSNRVCRAINRHGGEMTARTVTREPHPFDYPDQDLVLTRGKQDKLEARKVVSDADWIIQSGDMQYDQFEKLLKQFGVGNVNLGCRHAGSQYRADPEQYDDWDHNRFRFKRRMMACDLYRFVKDDPTARVYVQPQDYIADNVEPHEGMVHVCHTPSDRSKKGTKQILWAMQPKYLGEIEGQYSFNVFDGLPFEKCYAKRNRCQIFIDQHEPTIGGYGGAVMEALANGLAVISDSRHVIPEVDEMIPRPPIVQVRSQEDISKAVIELVKDPGYLHEQRKTSLAWAKKYLSSEFTYHYWKECLTL